MSRFSFISGHPAIDFINTVSGRHCDTPVDGLESFNALVEWVRLAGLIDPEYESELVPDEDGEAGRRRVVSRARRIREAAYEVLTARANREPVPPRATMVLTREVSQASHRRELTSSHAGFRWSWEHDRSPQSLVYRIAWSIADFLTSNGLDRLRVCDAPGCSWMFLDTTRNHSRRWCDPKTCGNRVRVRRHYRRRKAASALPEAG